MKKLLTLILMVISSSAYSQDWEYDINFEDTTQLYRLKIDKTANPNNCWQIGKPQKSLFTSAFSSPNVIITDTVNAYPTNDTSSFIVKHIAFLGFQDAHTVILSGKYFVNSDTLTDYGKIEFSPNNGITWLNLFDTIVYDTVYPFYYYWNFDRPTLTGNSGEWKSFWVNIARLGHGLGVQPFDTVLYRFSFISDSLQTNKNGLMFDDLHFEDWSEGIEEIQNEFESKISPNPTNGKIEIEFENPRNEHIEFLLFDINGSSLLWRESTKSNSIKMDLSAYESGIYIYKIINLQNKKTSTGKIIKE